MKKFASSLIFIACSFVFTTLSYADSCNEINGRFDGKWTYTQDDAEHIIEFQKGGSHLIHDGIEKEMWLCSYFPNLNIANFSVKNEYTSYSIDVVKSNKSSGDVELKLSINFKKYNLNHYSETNDSPLHEPNVASESGLEWEPTIAMDGHIFPSLLISTARWSNEAKETLIKNKPNSKFEVLGDPLGLFMVVVNNIKPDTKVKVAISLGGIASDAVYEGVLKQENKIYGIKPKVDYNYQQLMETKQPNPINVKFALYLDGEKVGEQTKVAIVRSVNDVPIASLDNNKQVIEDLSFVLAAYVNENNQNIDFLLREAIDTGEINSFSGYQSGAEGVYQQVYSIWNVLQRRGVRYSSITTPTAVSEKIFSQYVRFFDDTLNTSQANCIDGTVLFASILRRIGINPQIVRTPGHAFLGFDLDVTGTKVAYLETTMIGNTDLGQRRQGKSLDEVFSKLVGIKSMRNQKSFNSFLAALNEGRREALAAQTELHSNKNPNYKIIDINKARQMGIMPINH